MEQPGTNLPVNLRRKLIDVLEPWQPRVVATYNDSDVMVVRLQGPFSWHSHSETDDLFLVLSGQLEIELRDRTVTLGPGELFVVPRGLEHRPVAKGEVTAVLIERTGTPNTGDVATAAARMIEN